MTSRIASPDKGFPPAIFLLGPTASGKTAVSLELAQRFPIEIISVDSALVYRGMDIGTAKPAAAERAQVPHHLIDIIDPNERFSAAQFRQSALAAAAEITARNAIPVFAGGTMLYFKTLISGLNAMPGADESVRRAIDAQAAQYGWPHLHQVLAQVDAETAARLAPHDGQRIQRALEVFQITGRSLSDWHREETASDFPYRVLRLGLAPSDRAALHQRIEARFKAMLDCGLVKELQGLRARFALTADLPSMRCVGYRQAWQYLDGALSADELLERGIFATRQLAKRQLTWMRAMPQLQALDCLTPALGEHAIRLVATFLAQT